MTNVEVKGLDLKIDDSIHKLCSTSNATSSNTRGILYFIVLICLLSLISVLNTMNNSNWIESRINTQISKLRNEKTDNGTNNFQYGDYYVHRLKLEALNYNLVSNYMTVKLPILGTAFDVNDLAIVAGSTFIFLLLVLRFTIIREASNLNIALNAITGRYPSKANSSDFQADTSRIAGELNASPDDVLAEINRTRREHHYNFLCMNEVFNFPPLKSDMGEGKLYKRLKLGIAQLTFYLPVISYTIIVVNDHLSQEKGNQTNPLHTDINYTVMVAMNLIIGYLCYKCTRQERLIAKSYQDFFENDFQFKRG